MKGGSVYVALVDHPFDATSKARAAALIDHAITRKRTIHHAHGLIALMLACDTVPEGWLNWLEAAATTPVEKLIVESYPVQAEPFNTDLRHRARVVQVEAAAALAVLSQFKRTASVIEELKANAEPVAEMVIDFCKSHSTKPPKGSELDEVLALFPESTRAGFELAMLLDKPAELVTAAVNRGKDPKVSSLLKSYYCWWSAAPRLM